MNKIKVEQEIYVCSGREVANMLGLELRNFQRLIREGFVEGRRGHDEYDLSLCISTYREHLRHQKS